MHALANPARFLRLARTVTTWLLLIGLVLAVAGMAAGLTLTPPDYLQGETVRILYIHVPSAWLGMAGWLGIAAASLSQLVWRHPLAGIAGRAIAPAGATARPPTAASGCRHTSWLSDAAAIPSQPAMPSQAEGTWM